ncbi:hypothetical protein HYALB_00008326 [Hymenoscyphus albidus]|uniref:IQ domain-containing protein IQM6 n=1 Tax=Hymenoscyphus albidus TaxID=595503 RepID=A0A9N9LK28_9HELO|nr:hypothetical protein HYALB_00008326 [Hymenoscyphus albidus]
MEAPLSTSSPGPSVTTLNHTRPLSAIDIYPKSHTSKAQSVSTNFSARSSHQEYLDSLELPSHEMVEKISKVQEHKEEEVLKKNLKAEQPELSEDERTRAAGLIQRNYRGHRERRMLNGMSLDPSSRWVEAVKEARYRNLVQPRARGDTIASQVNNESSGLGQLGEGTDEAAQRHRRMSSARHNWMKIGRIARRAGGDEDSGSEESSDEEDLPEHEREARRKRRLEQKHERQKAAKVMDLQYFLEMVDLKHRYGSNLRTYHEEWKKSDTTENFFYWLDYGEGKLIDIQACPRERLEKEQVRYLSKEERLHYLVKINKDGRLCWAKNGALIDTTEKYKDSIHGIVHDTDDTPAYAPLAGEAVHHLHHSAHSTPRFDSHTSTSSSSQSSDNASSRATKYANPEFNNAKGVKKIRHVSAATIFNKLLRGSVKKNTWIFVADTSFRLYVGIKQSGAFQHSSFLHGSRISAAGLIKIKNGRLSKLSPLSGHYRPPVSNFRAFVHSLKDANVDMSHVSISRSYAVLVGLEAYVKTRRRGKKLLQKIVHHKDKMLSPEGVAKREELERDKSQSAAREKEHLARIQREEEESGESRVDRRLMVKLGVRPRSSGSHPSSPRSPRSEVGSGPGSRDGKSGGSSGDGGRIDGVLAVDDVDGKGKDRETHPIIQGSHPTLQTGDEFEKGKGKGKEPLPDPDIQAPGPGPENAIAPEGTRDT